MKPLLLLLPLSLTVCLSSCASRGPLLIGQPRPAISPDEVRVYAEPPAEFESIALLRGSEGGRQRGEELIEEFRTEAASVGANGVLLDWYADRGWRAYPGGSVSSVASNRGSGFGLGLGLSLQSPRAQGEARAIYVERE